MVELRAWRVLGADRPEVVLAADFPVTGRPEAGFGDLAAGLGGRAALWETLPPAPGACPPDGAGYTAHWLAEPRERGTDVRAVLGFCAGAVFAAALADGLKRWQDPPKLILLDPEKPAAPALYWQFHRVVDSFAAVLSAEERAAAQQEAQEARAACPDLAGFGSALVAIFRRTGEVAFARAGLTARRGAELVATFEAFVGYLGAAATLDPDAAWSSAVTISSADADDPVASAARFRFDSGHTELLRDPAVAETVAGLLGEG
ncbi:hypothetical protein [Saccharothrix australiensis]|uniref:Thioesterase domain-containing protein n=1 Tax=Saccharothrix australiensis TaxID=2072 RepID=A0A495W3M4_9PSEU|nr:hypothetical protein [Saccharothrix australiensis]RKT55647.1 hypothetical protein C8E97_4330 [Saccharothrix australiensis]